MQIIHFLADFWYNWQMLFEVIPYGNPYLSYGALVLLYFPLRRAISYIMR